MSYKIKYSQNGRPELINANQINLGPHHFCHISDYDKVESWFCSMFCALESANNAEKEKWQAEVIDPILASLPESERKNDAQQEAADGDGYFFISRARACFNRTNDANNFTTLTCKLLREYIASTFDDSNLTCKGLPLWHNEPL
tara:strand:- start:239468 stop:239899 length:432 start_codon:yes stop_codon:yes gene_type:complete